MISLLFNPTVWYILIAIVATILIATLCAKYPSMKQAVKVICIVLVSGFLVGSGIYSAIQLNGYYSAEGGLFGKISNSVGIEVVDSDNFEYKFENVYLAQEFEDRYSATVVVNKVVKVEDNKDYSLYVNEKPCSNVESSSQHLSGEYSCAFYDKDFNLIMKDTLNIRLAFGVNSIYFDVFTDGGSEAVKYWNYYFNKNDFVLRIKETEYIKNSSVDSSTGNPGADDAVPQLHKVEFYVDNAIFKTIFVNDGAKITAFAPPSKQNYVFKGWSLDGDAIVDYASNKVEADMKFYAVFDQIIAGMFDENNNVIYTWDEILDNGYLSVSEDGELSTWNKASQNLYGKIVLDESVKTIGAETFLECHDIVSVSMPCVEVVKPMAFAYCRGLKNVEFSDYLKEISSDAFFYTYHINTIIIPEFTEYVSTDAFYNCYGLVEIVNNSNLAIDESYSDSDYCVVHTGESQIYTIGGVNYMPLNDGEYIAVGLVSNDVANFTLSTECVAINSYAFAFYENLSSFTLNGNITEIPEYAFRGCSALKDVVISGNVNVIGDNAFSGCGLEKVVLLGSIEEVENYAFGNNPNLKYIFVDGNVEELPSNVFKGCLSSATLYTNASKPGRYWIDGWNTYDETNKFKVIYSVSYDEFINLTK